MTSVPHTILTLLHISALAQQSLYDLIAFTFCKSSLQFLVVQQKIPDLFVCVLLTAARSLTEIFQRGILEQKLIL
jgi:hypothetical protein